MTKNIALVLAMLMSLGSFAQETLVVKLKDGRTLKYNNGVETTDIHFFGTDKEGEEINSFVPISENESFDIEGLQVTDYALKDGNYAVAIAWENNLKLPEYSRMGICIGRTQGVTTENCDTLFYTRYNSLYPQECLALGDVSIFKGFSSTDWQGDWYENTYQEIVSYAWCNYPLQPGETYYYRIIADMYSTGLTDGFVQFVGPEQSFRIPKLKADAGYNNGDIYFSDEAWSKFYQHFPEDMSSNMKKVWQKSLTSLQQKWEETMDVLPYDITTATDLTFDDGVVHILPEVPEAFYTWMSQREIVITAVDTTEYASTIVKNNNNKYASTSFEIVDDVDSSFGIPSNSYIICTPNSDYNSYDSYILFNLTEAVPGVNYKLTVTFAPETRYTPEQDGEGNYIGDNAYHFLPVRLNMSYVVPSQTSGSITPWGYINSTKSIKFEGTSYYTTSAASLDVVEVEDLNYDFACSVLQINSSVQRSQLNKGLQTNELHIAEVRLTPIRPTE